jgi:hypothetical protein
MAATFGDSNGGEGPTKWNTKPIKRATDDELKRARSVLAPLENNHDCSRDGCDGAARDGSTHHYSHRASPDQHQYHDPGSPPQQLADNITTLVTVPHTDISTSSTKQQSDNNITGDEINLVCGEEIPASPLPTPPSPIQTFLDEKVEDCIKPTTTTTAATTTSTDTTSAALTSKVNLSRCRKISNSPTQLTLQQDLSPLSSFFPGTYNYVPVAVLEPHSPPGTPPPPSTTSPTSETPSGITIYRVAPGEEEEESDNEQEDLEDGELPAQDDDDTTLEERATAPK